MVERIRTLCKEKGISVAELERRCGIGNGIVARWKTSKPAYDRLAAVASELEVTVDYLRGLTDEKKPADKSDGLSAPLITDNVVFFPILGDVAAGYDHIAVEDWEGARISVPREYLHGRAPEDYFVLRVVGESMYPLYQAGDLVLVLRQEALQRSGEIGVVIYEGDHATLKKLEFVTGEPWLKLIPINPNFPPVTIEGEALENCRILGVPRLLIREME